MIVQSPHELWHILALGSLFGVPAFSLVLALFAVSGLRVPAALWLLGPLFPLLCGQWAFWTIGWPRFVRGGLAPGVLDGPAAALLPGAFVGLVMAFFAAGAGFWLGRGRTRRSGAGVVAPFALTFGGATALIGAVFSAGGPLLGYALMLALLAAAACAGALVGFRRPPDDPAEPLAQDLAELRMAVAGGILPLGPLLVALGWGQALSVGELGRPLEVSAWMGEDHLAWQLMMPGFVGTILSWIIAYMQVIPVIHVLETRRFSAVCAALVAMLTLLSMLLPFFVAQLAAL